HRAGAPPQGGTPIDRAGPGRHLAHSTLVEAPPAWPLHAPVGRHGCRGSGRRPRGGRASSGSVAPKLCRARAPRVHGPRGSSVSVGPKRDPGTRRSSVQTASVNLPDGDRRDIDVVEASNVDRPEMRRSTRPAEGKNPARGAEVVLG